MGWAAVFQAIAQGLTNAFSTFSYIKENKSNANQVAEQAQEQADYRAKQAKYAMQQQKTSFLKGGVYFNNGSAADVIDETYNTAMEDINDINKDSITNQKKLIRAGKTALFTFLIDPAGNNGGETANNIYQGFKSSNKTKKGIKVSGGIAGDEVDTTHA